MILKRSAGSPLSMGLILLAGCTAVVLPVDNDLDALEVVVSENFSSANRAGTTPV